MFLISTSVAEIFNSFALYEWVCVAILGIAFLIQALYYLVIFSRLGSFNPKKRTWTEKQEPVSVIICARNEYENLVTFLPVILEQDYPDFEVVVVNDCSDDGTQDLLEKLQLKYPRLKYSQIKHDEKFTHGKKLALTIGIKAAKNEWLLLTDADCVPNSKHWIAGMQRNFTSTADIVLGYGSYLKKKGFINKLIRYDTFFIALQYFSYALAKVPYMGVGRNLAYRKSVFMKNKGFASHAHLSSGDDDLFVNEVSTKTNTRIEFSSDTHNISIPKNNFEEWSIQKKRHLSTGNMYKTKHVILLSLENFSRVIFYLAVLVLLFTPNTWVVAGPVFLIRAIIQLIVLRSAMLKLNEKRILFFSYLFDIILPFINIFLYFANTINSKQRRWK